METSLKFSFVFCGVSLVFCLLTVILWALRWIAKFKKYNLSKWAIGTLFISIFFVKWAITIYEGGLSADSDPVLKAAIGMSSFERFMDSILHSLQTFSLDENYTDYASAFKEMLQSMCGSKTKLLGEIYLYTLSVLAPISIAAAVLSFFNEFVTNIKLKFTVKNLYIFSELNEKSITLAENILKEKRRFFNQIVFTDVYKIEEEGPSELIERAKSLNAWFVKRDILSINLCLKKLIGKCSFYVIGSDEAENIKHSVGLIRKYSVYKKFELYLFSEKPEIETVLENEDFGDMKVRCINICKSTIINHIYEKGLELFFKGFEFDYKKYKSEPIKEINSAILGLGGYGKEMLKALAWYCQIPGYKISITGYDIKDTIEDELKAEAPDLLSKEYCDYVQGNGCYDINIIGCIDVKLNSFLEKLKTQKPDYIFISLGDDSLNMSVAMKVRSYLLKNLNDVNIIVETIIHDDNKCKKINNLKCYPPHKENPKGSGKTESNNYDIKCFGNISAIYSLENVENKKLNEAGVESNREWESSFKKADTNYWKYSYNRNSSIANACHRHLRDGIKLPYAKKYDSNTTRNTSATEEESMGQITEHSRWNVYMRSIGYTYGPIRNNIAKTHNDLVPFDELPQEERKKDI